MSVVSQAGSILPLTKVRTGAYDRLFYSSMAVLMALTVFVGFSTTYYLRFSGDAPLKTLSGGPVTTLVHVHAALFTTWVLLFIVQTSLVAAHRVAMHRRLGIAGAVLAAAMIVAGTLLAIATAARGSAPAGMTALPFLIIPLADIALFTTFITMAIFKRRDKDAHKRLMLLAYTSVIVAAVARVPGVIKLGPPAFFGLALLFILAGVAHDLISRGRVHRVYIWGGALFIASVPLRLAISSTGAWLSFAKFLVG